MFGKEWKSLVEGVEVPNTKADYKAAKRLGQYRVSDLAIYKADGTYIPMESITDYVHDMTAVHVSGCCAGGVPVDRVVFSTESRKIPLIFDNQKQVDAIVGIWEAMRK